MRFLKARYFIIALALLLAFSASGFSQENSKHIKDIQKLIAELYTHPWSGAGMIGESPTVWDYSFTEPMMKILEVGAPAQDALLAKLSDPLIKDQIIVLLGGVGDERAVAPIINSMMSDNLSPTARRINSSANLALTNITVADVIWHHGGGIVIDRCPGNPKKCWQTWWKNNGKTFSVKAITQSRDYSNYPGYGIYTQH
jgi:hypothetical protein